MSEPVKINSFELENVKRVKAVALTPTANGLTVIGGKNAQGKTSVLDAITWAVGGDRYKPSMAQRDGSMAPPYLHGELSNGIVVERSGKNSSLKVLDPSGNKSGQALLNSFISEFALDLPKFMESSDKDKAKTLLQIIGVGDQLDQLDREEATAYNRRLEIGRIRDQKTGAANNMAQWDGVPDEVISASEMIARQQAILARNAQREQWIREYNSILDDMERVDEQVESCVAKLRELKAKREDLGKKAAAAQKSPAELQMESTAELEKDIAEIDTINAKIRDNMAKQRAMEEANQYDQEYKELTSQIDGIRAKRMNLLDGAKMPLEGLSVDHGELTYKGQKWDNMSSAEQLMVATAIVKELKPECGFVLLDKLEQMDMDTLTEFDAWLKANNLQAIGTRVSTGDECSIIIEDGYSIKDGKKTAETEFKPAEPTKKTWKAGTF